MQTGLYIFLKRKWETDKAIFKKFVDYYHCIQKNVVILIFPEGTNLTKESLERSDKFAMTNQLEKYREVIHPRTTGFIYLFNLMFNNNDNNCGSNATTSLNHIDDVTVAYKGGHMPLNELDFVCGNLPHEIHFFVDSFECDKLLAAANERNDSTIESIDSCMEKWLKMRWYEKEMFLRKFYSSSSNETSNKKNESQLLKELIEANYDTFDSSSSMHKTKSILIYFYAIYWLLSMTIISYFIYTNFLFKYFIMFAFMFYFVLIQLMGKDFDEMIIDSAKKNRNDADESTITRKVN
jgi:lysocardiolipin and lysophospholipid acyltransferase